MIGKTVSTSPAGSLLSEVKPLFPGCLHLSSDLDYALVVLPEDRDTASGIQQLPGITRDNIKEAPEHDTQIQILTCHGIVRGALSRPRIYTHLPASRSYQEVYVASLDSPIQPGDCGAVVHDAYHGPWLYGHVITGIIFPSTAFVVPAKAVYEDILSRFKVFRRADKEEKTSQRPVSSSTRSAVRTASTRHSTFSRALQPRDIATRSTTTAGYARSVTYKRHDETQVASASWQPAPQQGEAVETQLNISVLWYEMAGLTGCTAKFSSDDVSSWINHHFSHLDVAGFLPNSLCWFCDHNAFGSNNLLDGEANFWTRMLHIREHFVLDGYTQGDMRPDFFVVERLCDRGEIEKSIGDYLMSYSELPPQFFRPRFERQQQQTLRDSRAARTEFTETHLANEDRRRRRQARQR